MTPTLTGSTIRRIRAMTDDEARTEGWPTSPYRLRPVVLELSDGTRLYASRDTEGNGPGTLFAVTPGGDSFQVFTEPDSA